MRKMKVGKTGYAEAYKAVKEYRTKYPDKAVTFFAQQYPQYGWAILMAGGSCPNVPVKDAKLLGDVVKMKYVSGEGDSACQVIGNSDTGYLVYLHDGEDASVNVEAGKYALHTVGIKDGVIGTLKKKVEISGTYTLKNNGGDMIYWLESL